MTKYRIKSLPDDHYIIQETSWIGWIQILEPNLRGESRSITYTSVEVAKKALDRYLYLKNFKSEYTYIKNNS